MSETISVHELGNAGISVVEAENERLRSELSQSRAENALLVEALEVCREACRKNLVKYAVKDEPALLEAFDKAEVALTTLPGQAKEPLRDRDMLDWWEKRGAVNVCKSGGTYWTIEIWEGTFDAPTFREALAAAMKSDQGEK